MNPRRRRHNYASRRRRLFTSLAIAMQSRRMRVPHSFTTKRQELDGVTVHFCDWCNVASIDPATERPPCRNEDSPPVVALLDELVALRGRFIGRPT